MIQVPVRLLIPGVGIGVDRWARCGPERGPARRQAKALEDLAGHVGVFDGSEKAHRLAALGAAKRIDLEDTL